MTWRKRLRVLYAAWSQDWQELTCPSCGLHWFSQAWPVDPQCATCTITDLNAWADQQLAKQHERAVRS